MVAGAFATGKGFCRFGLALEKNCEEARIVAYPLGPEYGDGNGAVDHFKGSQGIHGVVGALERAVC